MTLDDIKDFFGSSYRFCKDTGMSHTNYVKWKRVGYVPILTQNRIEQITKGKLKADFKDAEKKYNAKSD